MSLADDDTFISVHFCDATWQQMFLALLFRYTPTNTPKYPHLSWKIGLDEADLKQCSKVTYIFIELT